MKGYKKNLFIVLLVILGVLTSAASAFGASKLKDDIKLTVKTDKDTYAKGEAVKLEISLENNSGSTIEDVTITPTIPKGLKVVGDIKALEFDEIKPGPEHKVLSTIALASAEEVEEKEVETESEPAEKKEEKEEKKETLPATGESNKILYLGLASILLGLLIFFGLKYGKRFHGILSMFIVAFLIIGLFPLATLADTGDDYETVEGSTTITVDGKEYTISATASFKVQEVEEPEEEETEEPEEKPEQAEPKPDSKPELGKVIIRFVDEAGKEIADSDSMKGDVGERWTAPEAKEIDGYKFVEIKGDKHGEYAEEDQEVVYVYKEIEPINPITIYEYEHELEPNSQDEYYVQIFDQFEEGQESLKLYDIIYLNFDSLTLEIIEVIEPEVGSVDPSYICKLIDI